MWWFGVICLALHSYTRTQLRAGANLLLVWVIIKESIQLYCGLCKPARLQHVINANNFFYLAVAMEKHLRRARTTSVAMVAHDSKW